MRNKIFEKIPITLPQRSGFDLSHENSGTAKPGILVPVFTRECEGRDSLSVNLAQQIQFPPFATDFYGRIKVYFEAFFVPYRIINASYKRQYEQAIKPDTSATFPEGYGVNPYFPGLDVPDSVSHPMPDSESDDPSSGFENPQSLLDYLGVKINPAYGSDRGKPLRLNNFNRLLAYHMIYQEYYRDSRIQVKPFHELYADATSGTPHIYSIPYMQTPWNNGNQFFYNAQTELLHDGYNICGLRSRSYAKDYFTMATPKPQFGNEMSVQADAQGNISISQIRAANALQQFAELYNRVGLHYDDLAFALTGIRPSDAAVDIPVYLGRLVYDVYNKSVFQQNSDFSQDGFTFIPGAPNPLSSAGSKYSNGQSVGSGHICDFTATEGGIFMILMSVAPDASYGTGTVRQWKYRSVLELPKPHLAGIGDQPIYKGELAMSGGFPNSYREPFLEDEIFGYTQRFAEAKFMLDETHGLLRDGYSLSSFSLKRSFAHTSAVNLGSAFLKVPTNALNEVSAIVRTFVSDENIQPFDNFYWFDLYFETKLVSNLPAYSLPTLENMHGPTAMVDEGGRRL